MAEHKVLGVILAAGLCLVAGIFALIDRDTVNPDEPLSKTVAVAPPASDDPTTTAALPAAPSDKPKVDQASNAPWSGKVLISKRPVEVLAGPSASASAMYGFPAGRPFRAIGREGGFVKIQDVRSGASGWIEEAALAPAPKKPVAATRNSGPKKSGASKKAKPSKERSDTETASAKPEPVQPRKRRGLFGGDGPLGGLFGGFGGR